MPNLARYAVIFASQRPVATLASAATALASDATRGGERDRAQPDRADAEHAEHAHAEHAHAEHAHAEHDDGYALVAARMVELARAQPGFVAVESARGADGFGITVSYWTDRDSIRAWKQQADHVVAQRLGRERFYSTFHLVISEVLDERHHVR